MDDVWRDDDTTPGKIEAALRNMFAQRHKEERAYVPARVMNMVVIVDKDFRGEIENRLVRVGRYHPSRLIFVAVEPGRKRLSATVRIGTDDNAQTGGISVGRERVELLIGERHVSKLDTIVDPLVVSDLATMVWAPHGHAEGVDALRRLAQIVLLDSQDEPTVTAGFTRSADLYGRCIAFVARGASPDADGSSFFVDVDALRTTANHHMITQGLAYPDVLPGAVPRSAQRTNRRGQARARRRTRGVGE